MNTINEGPVMDRIVHALKDIGPMTKLEIMQYCGLTRRQWGNAYMRLKVPTKRHPKRVHIHDWTREVPGTRDYLRPVYGWGDLPDKRKPKPISPSESAAKCEAIRNVRLKTASVFNLGVSVSELKRRVKQLREAA